MEYSFTTVNGYATIRINAEDAIEAFEILESLVENANDWYAEVV
jgi:hypothetical protein